MLMSRLLPLFGLPAAWLALSLSACGGEVDTVAPQGGSNSPSITGQPSDQSVTIGQAATFSVTAAGDAPLTYEWQRNGTPIAGATGSTYTTPAAAVADDGAMFTVIVSNSAGTASSQGAKLSVVPVSTGSTDVATYKNDLGRTGQNLTETALNPTNVNSTSFGLLRTLAVNGKVDAQPLYMSQLTISGAAHNVVFVATEHDSVYAFDVDSGGILWTVSLLGSGEAPSDTLGCYQVVPEIGITSTPVIDRAGGAHGIIYVVAMSKDGSSAYHQRLHALDLTTGAEMLGGPVEIAATFNPGVGTSTTFNASQYEERAALLLANGTVYTSWTSHCDNQPYTGWVIAYDKTTLARTSALDIAPNSGGTGPAIWMAGGGPAADAAGNVYLLTANGTFETTLDPSGFPNKQDYGNSFLRIAASGGSLAVGDYFAMSNEVAESAADLDLGSGGGMLLPDLTAVGGAVKHLMVGAGKDGNIYVVDRDGMGKFSSTGNNIWQELDGALPGGVWSTPAYFNGTVYYGESGGTLKAFSVTNAKLSSSPTSQSSSSFGYPGSSPVISANGTANGIVWAHQNSNPAVLHAYDAANLGNELYNSNMVASRDQFGTGNKFIAPMVANGRVFVGTTSGVAVFGLLH